MATTSTKKLTAPMLGILGDFNHAPRKARGEYSDGQGHVLRPLGQVGHFDGRSFNALVARNLLDYFTRCGCGVPCCCENNGYHITEAGIKAYAAGRASGN